MAYDHGVPISTITLGGKPQTMRLDFNAFDRLAGEGLNLMDPAMIDRLLKISKKEEAPTPGLVKRLVWGCLASESPDLTLQEVGRHIHPGNVGSLVTAFYRLFQGSTPTEADAKEGPSEAGSATVTPPASEPARPA